MEGLKGELVRIETKDGLELQGMLFEPSIKSNRILLHIHGWTGNFYENLFLDYIAKEAVSKGFAFLSYNNRGAGFVTDFIKNHETSMKSRPEGRALLGSVSSFPTGNSTIQGGVSTVVKDKNKRGYFRCGGSTAKFEDSIIDVSAGIDFVSKRGYENVVLEGHSLGCQKSAFYQYKTQDKRVKGLVLIAPVDDIAYVKRILGGKYEKQLEIARKMMKDGKGEEAVPNEMAFCPMLNARKYLDLADPTTIHGKIMDYFGDVKELKEINVPVLAIFGSKDDYEKEPEKTLDFLNKELKWDTTLIQGADHWFFGKEEELGKIIFSWISKNRI